MSLAEISVRRKVTTLMIFSAIILFGVISLDKLRIDLLPDIEFPKLTILTVYENASPREIETLITKPIEEAVSSVSGVLSVESRSDEDISIVTVKFGWGANMDFSSLEIREKVDLIKGLLPQDAQKSIILKFDPNQQPILKYAAIWNKSRRDIVSLRYIIEKEIKPVLTRVNGVASVEVIGGLVREIKVSLDIDKLYAYNVSIGQISHAIESSNYNMPAGSIIKGDMEYIIRTVGEFKNIEEIKNIVIGANENNVPIYLRDVAQVTDAFADKTSVSRFNLKESIGIRIMKKAGSNTIKVCDEVKDAIVKLRQKYRNNINFNLSFDGSVYISNAVSNVSSSAFFGSILAFLILLFFLKDIKSPLIVSLSIPISVFATFILMYLKGISLNMMSLGGLALAIGMLVDNSIVVLENISRLKALGKDHILSAILGTKEVWASVFASTLTTIAVFLPVVFVKGIAGEIFSELALTVSFAMLSSLLVSLFLIPMLSSIKVLEKKGKDNLIERKIERIHSSIETIYSKALSFGFKSKKLIFLLLAALMIVSFFVMTLLKAEFMPVMDEGRFEIKIELPEGTPIEVTDKYVKLLEKQLIGSNKVVKNISTEIGYAENDFLARVNGDKAFNRGVLSINLKKKRKESLSKIVSKIRKKLRYNKKLLKVDFIIPENLISGLISSGGKALSIQITGKNLDAMKNISNIIAKSISKMKGIYDVSTDFKKGKPELNLKIDKEKIGELGLKVVDVAKAVRGSLKGEISSKFKEQDREIDIRTRLREEDRLTREKLSNIPILLPTGVNIQLSQLAKISFRTGPAFIMHTNQSRVINISANVDVKLKSKIEADLKNLFKNLRLPEEISVSLAGENKQAASSFRNLMLAMILATVLVYMIIASQFESLIYPLLLMASIPLTVIGISFGLLITGNSINIMSIMGMVMLAGVVVNNAIVLYEFIQSKLNEGTLLTQAIIEGSRLRLRPILMTTCTTLFGLLPLALGIGEGSEMQAPLAVTVIFGLLASTFLTLIIIPLLFDSVGKLLVKLKSDKNSMRKWIKKR